MHASNRKSASVLYSCTCTRCHRLTVSEMVFVFQCLLDLARSKHRESSLLSRVEIRNNDEMVGWWWWVDGIPLKTRANMSLELRVAFVSRGRALDEVHLSAEEEVRRVSYIITIDLTHYNHHHHHPRDKVPTNQTKCLPYYSCMERLGSIKETSSWTCA
jgi:hypothetical protein